MEDCGQECLLQVELGPADCLVRNILINWYAGKHCVSCGKKFGEIHLLDHKPALLSPEGDALQWREVVPESIPTVLATHYPLCWDCYVTENFCHEHPELIVDRSHVTSGVPRDLIS
jgi:hypothetical protein